MRVGLTGGIASGKSTASAILADLGAVVIDYDALAREVVAPGSPGLAEIVQRFGTQVLDDGGALNRPALAEIVFHDPEALKDLESITHPLIRARAEELDGAAGPEAIVVHDNPLLVEMGGVAFCDAVIVVDVPTEVQISRMMSTRGMSQAEAEARVAAQTTRETRNGAADYVVNNTVSVEELKNELERIFDELRGQIGISGGA